MRGSAIENIPNPISTSGHTMKTSLLVVTATAAIGGMWLADVLGTATTGENGAPASSKKAFIYWCTKPVDEVLQWSVDYNAANGDETHSGEQFLAKYAFKKICSCIDKKITDTQSREERVLAGKLHGMHMQIQFGHLVDKAKRKEMHDAFYGLIDQNKALFERKPAWTQNISSTFYSCQGR